MERKIVSLSYVIAAAEAAAMQNDAALFRFILDSAFTSKIPESYECWHRYLPIANDWRMSLFEIEEIKKRMKDFNEDCWEILFKFILHL